MGEGTVGAENLALGSSLRELMPNAECLMPAGSLLGDRLVEVEDDARHGRVRRQLGHVQPRVARGVAGFKLAFLISATGAIVAALSVLLIPGRRRDPATELLPQAAVST